MKKAFKVALCGYYGYGNLGDELIAEALINLLRGNGIGLGEMVVLSSSPGESRRKYNTEAVDRNSPRSVWSTLAKTETFLFGGGGLFQDSTSFRSCLYYWGIVRMAERAGCIPWAFGQSIGPLRSRFSSYLAADAFRRCRTRIVRDDHSLEWLEKKGLYAQKAPDPVLGLSLTGTGSVRKGSMLVNLRPWKGDLSLRAAEAVSKVAERSGMETIGVALSPEDEMHMTELQEKGIIRCREIRLIESSRDASEVWSGASACIGMRLHFCVLSVMAGLRCVAVPYDPKVVSFAKEWDLPQWNGSGPLIVPNNADHPDLSAKTAGARKELEAKMGIALEKVVSGETHEA